MRAEVRNISSIKLVPENDSDRAILQGFINQNGDKSKFFLMQSYTVGDGRVHDVCVGFGEAARPLPESNVDR